MFIGRHHIKRFGGFHAAIVPEIFHPGRGSKAERLPIAYYERASKNPSAEFITKAAAFFGVTFDDLLGEVEKPKGKPGPEGKLRQVFDQAAELPRDQQKHIVRLVEDAMTAYRTRQAKTSTAA